MSEPEARRTRWEARYGTGDDDAAASPAAVLVEHAHLLPPPPADALDLACGLGGSALWLAERGYRVSAWDYAQSAIEKLAALARARGLALDACVRDVERMPPEPARFDVIVVRRFLSRPLAPALVQALRPGGLLFYETFTREQVDESGPSNPQFRLGTGELLVLFCALRTRVYREEGLLGDRARGLRNVAWLVAERPA